MVGAIEAAAGGAGGDVQPPLPDPGGPLPDAAGLSSRQDANAGGIAAVEAAAGLVGRGFAAADVQGDARGLVTPRVLETIGRELVRRGEAVFAIEGAPRAMRLAPAGTWDVRGGDDPATWWYRLDLFGASDHRTRLVAAPGVVHARINTDPVRWWLGRAPWRLAPLTAATAANTERAAALDARTPSARIVPTPATGTPDQIRDLLARFRDRIFRGGVMAVEASLPSGFGEHATRAREWSAEVVRPDPAQSHVELRGKSAADILGACGIPPALMDPRADGTTRRESYRQFVMATLAPWGRIVAEELADKLDAPGLRLDFGVLQGADLASRGRALKTLADAGVPLADALAITGLVGGEV